MEFKGFDTPSKDVLHTILYIIVAIGIVLVLYVVLKVMGLVATVLSCVKTAIVSCCKCAYMCFGCCCRDRGSSREGRRRKRRKTRARGTSYHRQGDEDCAASESDDTDNSIDNIELADVGRGSGIP